MLKASFSVTDLLGNALIWTWERKGLPSSACHIQAVWGKGTDCLARNNLTVSQGQRSTGTERGEATFRISEPKSAQESIPGHGRVVPLVDRKWNRLRGSEKEGDLPGGIQELGDAFTKLKQTLTSVPARGLPSVSARGEFHLSFQNTTSITLGEFRFSFCLCISPISFFIISRPWRTH